MFLEGARWDDKEHQMGDSNPKELFSNLPLMHLNPVADREIPTSGMYKCPLYKVESRAGTLSTTGHSTNFITFTELKTSSSENVWIIAGVAAFLSLRY
jgi:dynein heavy chain